MNIHLEDDVLADVGGDGELVTSVGGAAVDVLAWVHKLIVNLQEVASGPTIESWVFADGLEGSLELVKSHELNAVVSVQRVTQSCLVHISNCIPRLPIAIAVKVRLVRVIRTPWVAQLDKLGSSATDRGDGVDVNDCVSVICNETEVRGRC